MLKDPDPQLRACAAQVLQRIRPAPEHAVPALEALALTGKDSVPELTRALYSSRSWYLRFQAALALGAIGPEAQDAVAWLERALKDPNHYVRNAAAQALKQITGKEYSVK